MPNELAALRSAVESAHFADADARARMLLSRTTLSARARNDALELLAIAQIAARDETAARGTLDALFARDPEHTPRVRDPGPTVEATFERIRSAAPRRLSVPLSVSAMRDGHERVLVQVGVGSGRDAVDTVHVFAAWPTEVAPGEHAAEPGAATTAPREASHLVVELGLRSTLMVALPAAPDAARALALYVEARAPSGAVLGSDGSASAPLTVHLDPRTRCLEKVPLRQRWWLWTSVAIAVAGIAIGGGLAAH